MIFCSYNHFYKHLLILIVIFITSCAPPAATENTTPNRVKIRNNDSLIKKNAQKFLEISSLGTSLISKLKLNNSISNIDKSKKIFIAKVDNLTLGVPITNLNQWSIAFENGIVKGLLENNFRIAEKLDNVNIRNSNEFLDTYLEQGFYMHPIDLESHKTIINQYDSPYLFEYQVSQFSEDLLSAIVYVRIIDLNSLNIITSSLLKVGQNFNKISNLNIDLYDKIYSSIKYYQFPDVFDKLSSASILDIDILNISGNYRVNPSEKLQIVENAIISGIIDNKDYNKNTF